MIWTRQVAHTNHSHTPQTHTLTKTQTNRTFGSTTRTKRSFTSPSTAERVAVILVVNVPPGQLHCILCTLLGLGSSCSGVPAALSALQRRDRKCEDASYRAPPSLPSVTPEPYGTAWLTGTGTSAGSEEKQETAAGQRSWAPPHTTLSRAWHRSMSRQTSGNTKTQRPLRWSFCFVPVFLDH